MDIMELLAKGKEEVAFILDIHSNDGFSEFAHFNIKIVYVDRSSPSKADIGYYDNYLDQKHQYKNLTITSQMSANCDDGAYGWSIGVVSNRRAINFEEGESIIKTLRPIRRKLLKISDREGCAESFDEFVVRIARILNVSAFWSRDLATNALKFHPGTRGVRLHTQKLMAYANSKLTKAA